MPWKFYFDIKRCLACNKKLHTYFKHPNGYVFKQCLQCMEIYQIIKNDKK